MERCTVNQQIMVGTVVSLRAACMFSQCLRGLSSGCPGPSHTGAVAGCDGSLGVSGCCVSCDGLVTCPE